MILSKPDNPGKAWQGLWLLPSKLLTPVLKGTVTGIQHMLWSAWPWKNRISLSCLPLSSKHSVKMADRPTRLLGDVFELRQLLQMLKSWRLNFHGSFSLSSPLWLDYPLLVPCPCDYPSLALFHSYQGQGGNRVPPCPRCWRPELPQLKIGKDQTFIPHPQALSKRVCVFVCV